jgi:hypothetical protein
MESSQQILAPTTEENDQANRPTSEKFYYGCFSGSAKFLVERCGGGVAEKDNFNDDDDDDDTQLLLPKTLVSVDARDVARGDDILCERGEKLCVLQVFNLPAHKPPASNCTQWVRFKPGSIEPPSVPNEELIVTAAHYLKIGGGVGRIVPAFNVPGAELMSPSAADGGDCCCCYHFQVDKAGEYAFALVNNQLCDVWGRDNKAAREFAAYVV